MTGSMVLNFDVRSEDKEFAVCKNCNTINKSTNLKCSSCNAPLAGSMVIDKNFNPVLSAGARPGVPAESSVNQQSSNIADSRTEHYGLKTCKKCAYPNMAAAKFCVKCNSALNDHFEAPAKPHATRHESAAKADPNKMATVNPWISEKKDKENKFILIPADYEAKHKADHLTFSGERTELNRDNLDPDNPAITSSVQAVIYKKGNKWIISNQSKLNTTFVRIDSEMEITDGMVLMFGNRCFQFREDKNK